MTMIIDGTNGLTFNNGSTQVSAGQVLQVVSASITSATTTASTTFVTTGLATTITPKFSTSKILILLAGGYTRVGSVNNSANVTGYRGGTNLGGASRGLYQVTNAAQTDFPNSINYYDSPATTSSTTYTVYIHTDSSTSSFGLDSIPCTLTLLEIAA